MSKVNVYNHKGEVTSEVNLPKDLFNCKVNEALVHQAVVTQMANKRIAIADTKGRAEVRGGGKKPWRQKGTGRARHGSSRSPIWKGGGVTFGPTKERNFSKQINKKMGQKALAMALSDRAEDKHIIVIDSLDLSDMKTKNFLECVKKLPNKDKKTLLLLSKKEKKVKRATDNIDKVKAYKADSVQALQIVTYPYLMMSKDGLNELIKTFSEEKVSALKKA